MMIKLIGDTAHALLQHHRPDIFSAFLTLAASAAFDGGPPVGSTAPELKALDTAGRPLKLADIVGKSGVVVAFVRSAA